MRRFEKAFVGHYRGVVRSGNFVLLCPFHADSAPSLYVDLDDGRWHCFGCDRGTSKIQELVAGLEGVEPQEAIQIIKSRGVQWSDFSPGVEKKNSQIKRLQPEYLPESDYNFEEIQGVRALSYLDSRGVPLKLAKTYEFRMGRNYPWDDRIIFPIRDRNGKLCAIKGRSMAQLGVTLRYYEQKGSIASYGVFGILQLPKRKTNPLFIVEGPFDVLAMRGAGFRAVVGLCGSFIERRQAVQLRDKTDFPVVVLDGPRAGTEQGRDDVAEKIRNVMATVFPAFAVVTIPHVGKDPSELYDEGRLKSTIEKLLKEVGYGQGKNGNRVQTKNVSRQSGKSRNKSAKSS